jgi:hypothetical protein
VRFATNAEIEWCNKLRRLMRSRPKTMSLFADGQLKAVCAREAKSFHERDEFQPLEGVAPMGNCDGGDPWKDKAPTERQP